MAHQPGKILELEGVRGLAALLVVLSHLQATFFAADRAAWTGSLGALAWPLRGLVQSLSCAPFNGRFPVWIFWCMSAFALSYHFFSLHRQGAGSRQHAYLLDAVFRRYFRLLFPVLASTLFAYVLLRAGLMHNRVLAQELQPGHPGKWLFSFYHFTPSLRGALHWAFYGTFFSFHVRPEYNPILWTMRREILGSYFLFAFLALFGTLAWRWPLYLLAGLFFAMVHQVWLLAFLAGIALCDFRVNHDLLAASWPSAWSWLQRGRGNLWLLLPALLVLFCLVGYMGADPVAIETNEKDSLLNIVVAAAAILMVQYFLPLKRLLSGPGPVFLGKISFGLYISHFPFIMSFSALAYLGIEPRMGHLPGAFLIAGLTLPAVIGLGYAFYLGADRPALKMARQIAAWIMNIGSQALRLAQKFVPLPAKPAGELG
jgi:peptidoglycan/LPS O-acetylase OafA/YrhL